MATSGTTSFTLDLSDIIEEAFERASAGTRAPRTGYDWRTARRSLSLLALEWANRGLNLWTLEEGTIPLVAGVSEYDLPADTIDLVEHQLRINSTPTPQDYSITRIGVSTYASIPNKESPGRPVQIYILRLTGAPKVRLWPVPDNAAYQLYYWRMRRIQDVGGADNTQDVPFRFIPAMVAGLAYHIAQKIPEGAPLLASLKESYTEQWLMASDEDRDRASVYLIPQVGR